MEKRSYLVNFQILTLSCTRIPLLFIIVNTLMIIIVYDEQKKIFGIVVGYCSFFIRGWYTHIIGAREANPYKR